VGFFNLFGKEAVVGIDIGSRTIKAVEIEATGSGWRVVNAGIEPTPEDTCKDGVITDVAEVAHVVKSLLKTADIRAQGAIAAVSGSQVIVRQVQLPKMNEFALRKSIKFEAGKYVSASVDDSVVECQVLKDSGEGDQMNVMLVAAPNDMVGSRVAVLEMAGLEPFSIDVEAFALVRSLAECSKDPSYKIGAAALVDMGASHTDVNIVCAGEFALTRNIPIAGDSFTNAIKALANLSFQEAVVLKFETVLPGSSDQPSVSDAQSKRWRVVQPLLDELLREIRRSIHFYQSQFPEGAEQAAVKKVILSGGSAQMSGMAAYVSAKLNIPAEISDLFNNSVINCNGLAPGYIEEHGPVLAIATGLALKEEEVSAARLAA